MTLIERLQSPPSRWITYPVMIAAAAACLFLGFYAGQLYGPTGQPRVEESTVVVNVTRTKKVEQKALQKKTYDKKITLPDGTKTEEHSEILVEKDDTKTDTDSSISTKTDKVTTPQRPMYRATLMVGYAFKEPALPITGGLVVGVAAEARLGSLPLWVGIWGSTQGAIGGQISGDLPFGMR